MNYKKSDTETLPEPLYSNKSINISRYCSLGTYAYTIETLKRVLSIVEAKITVLCSFALAARSANSGSVSYDSYLMTLIPVLSR
jgi:hypothetical protein